MQRTLPDGRGSENPGYRVVSKLYARLFAKLLPGFKNGHTLYVQFVKNQFMAGCRWLDAGGGRRIFHDLYDGERDLVKRARQVVVCDGDLQSLKDHVSVSQAVCCNLGRLPLRSQAFDFLTCGMVVEHLSDPAPCIREMGRVLDKNGRIIIHTVNLWGYPTLLARLSKLLPSRLRRTLISKITNREEDDIFPTFYRCNTVGTFRRLFREAGLQIESAEYLPAGSLFAKIPGVNIIELLLIKLTLLPWFRRFRAQLLVLGKKPEWT